MISGGITLALPGHGRVALHIDRIHIYPSGMVSLPFRFQMPRTVFLLQPHRARLALLVALLLSACSLKAGRMSSSPEPRDAFWASLQSLCGQAFAGRLTQGTPADSIMRRSALVMHVRECSDRELRIPFHVGADRSRTWVLTRTADGLRLKHDHRHADGTPDAVTQYGGDTQEAGSGGRQAFHADAHTVTLIPAARTSVWTMEVTPGSRFVYELRRVGTDRWVRVEFDLAASVPTPPAPWGAAP